MGTKLNTCRHIYTMEQKMNWQNTVMEIMGIALIG